MAKRSELHKKLMAIKGIEKVYYQPPESIRLVYPCILYEKSNIKVDYANDSAYKSMNRYTVTIVHTDVDNDAVDQMLLLQYCSFDRYYVASNLHHYVFDLFY